MKRNKPNMLYYRLAQIVSWNVSAFLFRRKILRNEIKGKKGPFVVIANHQAALDFVNLIGITRRPMNFVISNSFYQTLPITGFLDKLGVIPKQQFQTTVQDMKRMKAVIEDGGILVLYPAGLMCEDGLSTPIPQATYKFLQWIGADIYVAKTSGTYFAMPKWTTGIRPGRTYLDVYKLFDKDELAEMELQTVRERTDEAILFDAYREQENYRVRYKDNSNMEGLEQVLYMCPHCLTEFSMQVQNGNTIRCSHCGYEQVSDEYAFLHNRKGLGEELRYVSDWSRHIYGELKRRIRGGEEHTLSADTAIHMIHPHTQKFAPVGRGRLTLTGEQFTICGEIDGQPVALSVPIKNFASLPFSPGKHLEIQHGKDIYRCVLEDGRLVMKFINMVKVFYELNTAAKVEVK